MYYIGIDVGGTNLVAGLVDADGHIQDKASRPVPRDMTAQQFGGYLVELAEQVCEKTGTPKDQIEAVGIGLPGAVDNQAGLFVHNPNMHFSDRNVPLREMFQAVWNVPVYLGNDANCAAIGEYWAGAAKGCDPAVVITLGTGIGGGMVSGGKLFTGFANSVAAPAIEFKQEGWVFGVGCKIFTIAGPVILYGIVSSWLLGFIYWGGKGLGFW